MNAKIIYAFVLFSFAASFPVLCTAKDAKDTKNNFGRMVIFKGESSSHIGFVMVFKEKKYIVTSMDSVYECGLGPVADSASVELKHKNFWIPSDGRELAFLEIAGEDERPSLDASEKLDPEEAVNSKIYAYGLSSESDSGPFVSAQGKINGLAPESISHSLKFRKNEDLSGGPIISDRTGNVIGVVKALPDDEYTGIRLDNLEKLVEINEADYLVEAKRFCRIEDNFNGYAQNLKDLPKMIKDALLKVRKEKTLAGAEKNAVINTYAALSRDFSADYMALKGIGKSKIAFFNRKSSDLLKAGAKMNDDIAERKKDVDDLDRKFGEYFEKQKLKEVNKIK
ncbi:MAG TPA: hypothetical protein DCZ94_06585 [Lentisphaeria bacterium]|nr:MAG: hypothetical protein A2X48_10795 [Lentisphaerae bacterium GWF2_49_21]HBC86602.1 hypothetical protein [Lentisphaeria bacterium]